MSTPIIAEAKNGGLRVDQAHRVKELEQENSRLKRLVADLSLDNAILKEAAGENFGSFPERSRLLSCTINVEHLSE